MRLNGDLVVMQACPFGYNQTMPARLFSRYLLILTVFMVTNAYPQELPGVVTVPAVNMPVPDPLQSDQLGIDPGAGLLQAGSSGRLRDVVLVLDNSTSMKTNDPQYQLGKSVTEYIARMGDDTNIAIILFDQEARLALPLLPATLDNRERVTAALAQLDYNGTYSDSAAGLEKAVSELQNSGRNNADKYIVFMTDSGVETSDGKIDTERSAWLQQGLAVDIAEAGIRIYALGFARAANSELISTMALKTGGESFHALQADELSVVFTDIFNDMQQDASPVPVDTAAVAVEPSPALPVVVTAPVAPVQPVGQEDRTRSMIIIIAAVILILTLGTLIVLLVKRGRIYKQASETHASEAYLYDLNGRTSAPRYTLGIKATMFGRVAGKDSGHLDYIVIPESTIGRRHATIEYKDYAYWIMDQGSINGTFVNDVCISSETRLKHGDRIRLHKVEFDFIMPDMEAAGETRLAEPAGANASSEEEDVDAIKSSMAGQAFDLDLDFSAAESSPAAVPADQKDETLLPGFAVDAARADPDEVTLMPDYNYAAEPKPAAKVGASSNKIKPYADETLMPNSFKNVDDEATIRPSINSSSDGIFDVTGADDKDR